MKYNEKTFYENPHQSIIQILEDINIVNPHRIVNPHHITVIIIIIIKYSHSPIPYSSYTYAE